MSELPCNRCVTPDSDQARAGSRWEPIGLCPLWIWLAIAALASVFGTPADPYSMLFALAYGLVCFWIGVVLASAAYFVLRILPLVLFVAAAIWGLAVTGGDLALDVMLWYGAMSIACGAWAFRAIHHVPWRILAGFSFGYALGIIGGPAGVIVGAVFGAELARRLPRKQSRVVQSP